MKNIVFLGTKDFAAKILEKLIKKHIHITHVFTKPDEKMGRGQKFKTQPVKTISTKYNINTHTYNSINSNDAIEKIKEINPEIILMVEYGEKLLETVFQIPRYGIINIHPSILPHLRGATPIEHAILLGKKETGVSIIKINKKIDAGVILHSARCNISNDETYKSLSKKLTHLSYKTFIETLKNIKTNTTVETIQNDNNATYTKKFDKTFYKINWNDSAITINRKIRSTFDTKKHHTIIKNTEIKIIKTKALIQTCKLSLPGKIINITQFGIDVATKNNILRIKDIQIPGKNINSIKNILNSKKDLFKIGDVFE